MNGKLRDTLVGILLFVLGGLSTWTLLETHNLGIGQAKIQGELKTIDTKISIFHGAIQEPWPEGSPENAEIMLAIDRQYPIVERKQRTTAYVANVMMSVAIVAYNAIEDKDYGSAQEYLKTALEDTGADCHIDQEGHIQCDRRR